MVTFSVRLTDSLVWTGRFDISFALNPLSFPLFLAVMAWNIDYEHDSEEVILLKKQIAEQGSSLLLLFMLLDSSPFQITATLLFKVS